MHCIYWFSVIKSLCFCGPHRWSSVYVFKSYHLSPQLSESAIFNPFLIIRNNKKMLLSAPETIKICAFLCVLELAVMEQLSAEKILSSIEETVLLHAGVFVLFLLWILLIPCSLFRCSETEGAIQLLQAAVPLAPVWVLILEMLSSKAALINHPGC